MSARADVAPGLQQRIDLPEDDAHGWLVSGYRTQWFKFALLLLVSVPLLGLPLLFAYRWSRARAWTALVGRKCRLVDATYLHVLDVYGNADVVPVRAANGRDGLDVIYVAEYRHVRIIVEHNGRDDSPLTLVNAWHDPGWSTTEALRQPLTAQDVHHRELYFGPNVVDVDTKSIWTLLVDEVLHPFYVFQWFSIILWCVDDYFVYSAVLFFMSVMAIVSTLRETRRQLTKMQKMARVVCDVRVRRGTGVGEWINLTSDRLVPGDVVDLASISGRFPCDLFLVAGDAIVNEALLTGESVPAAKRSVTDAALQAFDPIAQTLPITLARHLLFDGTQAVRIRPPGLHNDHGDARGVDGNGPVALGVVARTGFNTAKGQLIRAMLFPRPAKVALYRDAFQFVFILSILAVVGFVYTFINFLHQNVPHWRIVIRALDLVTVSVPPALPLTIQVGAAFALARLRTRGVYCSAPTRIHLAGKVDLVVYDKTGTLTEDGLTVLGVRAAQSAGVNGQAETEAQAEMRFSDLRTDAGTGATGMKRIMAACVDVTYYNGVWLGDPLEVEALRWTRWKYEELPPSPTSPLRGYELAPDERIRIIVRPYGSPARASSELAVLRWFDFDPDVRRMTVLARHPLPGNDIEVLCKGAPEAVRARCRPESVPRDFDAVVDEYTRCGYRVLAFASRTIAAQPAYGDVGAPPITSVSTVTRDQAECDLDLQGFVVYENRLKEETTPVVLNLCDARVRQVVCTGDAVLTALSVARECGIIASLATVYAPERTPDGQTEWVNVDRREDRMALEDVRLRVTGGASEGSDSATHTSNGNGGGGERKKWNWGKRASRVRSNEAMVSASTLLNEKSMDVEMSDVRVEREIVWVLAVTGEAFREIVASGDESIINQMLIRGQVFARMSPDDKRTLVELFRDRLGYRPAYCGDGANDCAALKAADVGISLSEMEASAAAPFTSHVPDIRCVPAVIREGRAALVTSVACFKYMALYGLVQFTTLSLVYSIGRILGNGQFLYIDLIVILPIALLLGRTRACKELAVKRPTLSLMSGKVLVSLVGQIALQAAFQIGMFILTRRQLWFHPAPFPNGTIGVDSQETTVLFYVSCFMYIGLAVVFSGGYPYRRPIYTNYMLSIVILVLAACTVALVLIPPPFLQRLMPLQVLPIWYRGVIVAVGFVYFALALGAENFVFPMLARLGSRVIRKRRANAMKSGRL